MKRIKKFFISIIILILLTEFLVTSGLFNISYAAEEGESEMEIGIDTIVSTAFNVLERFCWYLFYEL